MATSFHTVQVVDIYSFFQAFRPVIDCKNIQVTKLSFRNYYVSGNIVFMYPVSKVVQTLKEKYSQDERYTIYETDNHREGQQIIDMCDGCVVVTSDYKKFLRLFKT
jgi:hypothetical protein